MSDEQHTQAPDDPSGPGWRDVTTGGVTQDGDMVRAGRRWSQARPGETVCDGDLVRRRIQPQAIDPDDPSGPGWRDLEPDEILQDGDMFKNGWRWEYTCNPGAQARYGGNRGYRRRIEPQPSNSEPETIDDLRQLRERAQKAEHELASETKRYRDSFRDHHRDGQRQIVEALRIWLRPVLELVADDSEDCAPLAVAVLGYLPDIARRLIEETVDEGNGQR